MLQRLFLPAYLYAQGYSLSGYKQHRCIFVRIPKCATRSISISLFGNKGGGHTDIGTYRVLFGARFDDYFKFAFVRNPWDRVVSAYHFLKQGGVNREDRRWCKKHLSRYADFNEFVMGWLKPENIRLQIHFKPQYEFVQDTNGDMVMDFIGHYENLENDFMVVKEKLGMRKSLLFLNKTTARKRNYRDYFSEETKRIVADLYSKDIASFGYNF